MGIIGANANCDWSKRAHLPALLGMPDFELTAVCASRPETVEESRAFYGANPAFHDCTEMSNDPDVDLVVAPRLTALRAKARRGFCLSSR